MIYLTQDGWNKLSDSLNYLKGLIDGQPLTKHALPTYLMAYEVLCQKLPPVVDRELIPANSQTSH